MFKKLWTSLPVDSNWFNHFSVVSYKDKNLRCYDELNLDCVDIFKLEAVFFFENALKLGYKFYKVKTSAKHNFIINNSDLTFMKSRVIDLDEVFLKNYKYSDNTLKLKNSISADMLKLFKYIYKNKYIKIVKNHISCITIHPVIINNLLCFEFILICDDRYNIEDFKNLEFVSFKIDTIEKLYFENLDSNFFETYYNLNNNIFQNNYNNYYNYTDKIAVWKKNDFFDYHKAMENHENSMLYHNNWTKFKKKLEDNDFSEYTKNTLIEKINTLNIKSNYYSDKYRFHFDEYNRLFNERQNLYDLILWCTRPICVYMYIYDTRLLDQIIFTTNYFEIMGAKSIDIETNIISDCKEILHVAPFSIVDMLQDSVGICIEAFQWKYTNENN